MPRTPNQLFNTLNEHFGQLLPDLAKSAQEDVHNHVKAVVNSVLSRLDLVTREEFEIQLEVLRRTRAKVEALEQRVSALEARLETPAAE